MGRALASMFGRRARAGSGAQRPRPLTRTVLTLGVLLLVDSFLLGQGLLSLFVSAIGTTLLVLGAIWSAIRRAGPTARMRVVRAGLYVLLGVMTSAAGRVQRYTGDTHAQEVIAACKAYRAAHGAFPDRLDDLVPEYLPKIPRARLSATWNQFSYWNASFDRQTRDHILMYTVMPPFGRRVYHLEQDRWSTLD